MSWSGDYLSIFYAWSNRTKLIKNLTTCLKKKDDDVAKIILEALRKQVKLLCEYHGSTIIVYSWENMILVGIDSWLIRQFDRIIRSAVCQKFHAVVENIYVTVIRHYMGCLMK
ncbi:hypothetical protein ACFXTH_007777 [Malus domestica]